MIFTNIIINVFIVIITIIITIITMYQFIFIFDKFNLTLFNQYNGVLQIETVCK